MKDSPRLVLRVLLYLLICLPGHLSVLNAQIGSAGYSSVAETGYETEYPDTTLIDNIYIFCNEKGNLSASFDEVSGDLTFEWSLYEHSIPGFGDPFITGQGESSRITDLESGGYQVRIRDRNDLDTLFRAWVFVNRPRASAEIARYDCGVLDLEGTIEIDTFFYYDPYTYERDTLPVETDILWSADPEIPVAARPDPRIWDPPPVVTEYTLKVVYYSCEAVYTLTVDPLTTRAEFEINPPEGEAQLEVNFDAGMSQNADEYEWFFYYHPDTTNLELPDGYATDPVYTYEYDMPGEYFVMLRTISEVCDDFYMHPEPIRVYFSELEVPNVFSPDGDGYNDVFTVRAVSLRQFHAVIQNRHGRKVFEWRDPSEGWDGTIDGNLASPGVYYYIITGEGWDDIEYEFTGPVYLYRGR